MSQINININQDFEETLQKFMRIRKIKNKSEAIRIAIRECLENTVKRNKNVDFSLWLAMGKKVPPNTKTKFHSHDDLWR